MGSNHRLLLFLVVLLSIWSDLVSADGGFGHFFNPKFSHAPHYTSSQLYSTPVGFEQINGYIGCFGDFNSDKYTDIFVISQNRSEVTLYLWNTNHYKFEKTAVEVHYENAQIVGVAATDLNRDGKLDVLVQLHEYSNMSTNPPSLDVTKTKLRVYLGDYSKFVDEAELPTAVFGQVMLMEATGDLFPDLLGNYPTNTGHYERSIWVNGGDGKTWTVKSFSVNAASGFSNPHSNALVDFNGDCMPDLFVTSSTTGGGDSEIIILDPKTGQFTLKQSMKLPPGAGQVTFGDFDADGAVDLLFPVCHPVDSCTVENSIRIYYNIQKKICGGLFSKNCRKSTDLCVADDSFSFEIISSEANPSSTANFVLIPQSAFGDSRIFATVGNHQEMPLTLRAGDYNIDRYLDLLVPVLPHSTNLSQVALFKNVPCTDDICGHDATQAKRRTFVQQTQGTDAMANLIGAYTGAWFDLDEDGSLDILAMMEVTNSVGQRAMSLAAITNNYFNDGYFVKTLALNGLCTVNCNIKEIKLDRKPYGVNQHGAVWKYTLADLHGTQLVSAVPQLPQSAYNSLQTPYVLSGLGRPSNYIDYVYMGVPVLNTGKEHFQSWPGIIPNSQVVVAPYPIADPVSWAIELYISPSGALLWIAIAVAVCLLISGGGILFFQWLERKADEAEKKDKEHLFSFSAM